MSSSLGELCERAEELGIADELAEVVGAYVDAAERAARSCEAFRWGDSCEGTQLVYLPPVPPVLVAIGPVVEITYEATKGGELAHWVHEFGRDRPVLAYDDSPRGNLYFVGGGYKVRPAGIVG